MVTGFYGIEEHVDDHWFECIGVDVGSSSLYKANVRSIPFPALDVAPQQLTDCLTQTDE